VRGLLRALLRICRARLRTCRALSYFGEECVRAYIHILLSCLVDCAVCCNVLQCVAVCCSVLQCVAVYTYPLVLLIVLCVAMCCNVLQCVAVCCSVLQCVAVYTYPFVLFIVRIHRAFQSSFADMQGSFADMQGSFVYGRSVRAGMTACTIAHAYIRLCLLLRIYRALLQRCGALL